VNLLRFLLIAFGAGFTLTGVISAGGEPPIAATSPSTRSTTTASTLPAISAAEHSMIDALNADDWRARQSAEDGLIGMGPGIRPAMIALRTSGTPEQRTRAEAILAKLDIAAANSPTLITLHFKEANPREVFAAIAKQADIEISIWPEDLWTKANAGQKSTITIDMDQQPFWNAIAEICRVSGGRVTRMGGPEDQNLTIQPGNVGEDWFSGPRSVDGQFIVLPQQFARNRTVTFAPAVSTASSDIMQFRILVDPKANLLRSGPQMILSEAQDDKGNSLLTKNVVQFGDYPNPGLWFDLPAAVAYADDGATKLKSLEGHLFVTIAKRMEHLDLPDVKAAVGQAKSIGKWTLTVQACQIGSRDGSITVSITAPERNFPADEVYSLMRRIKLVDASGRTINFGAGFGGSGDGLNYPGNQSFTTNEPIQPPVHLKWNVPVAVEEKRILFHFTDLPLPTP
jgi:hypothetical protein